MSKYFLILVMIIVGLDNGLHLLATTNQINEVDPFIALTFIGSL